MHNLSSSIIWKHATELLRRQRNFIFLLEIKERKLPTTLGNSLAIQWLGLRTLTAQEMGSIPCLGTNTPQATGTDQKTNKQKNSLVGCSPWGRKELDTTERLNFHFSLSCIGEGNGNPLQCSCLENPRDGGAWWAAIYGVAQSRTWLKQLSSSSSSKLILWVSQVVKNPPANARDLRDEVQFLGQEDPLEEGRATHSSILAWRIPWTEEPDGL